MTQLTTDRLNATGYIVHFGTRTIELIKQRSSAAIGAGENKMNPSNKLLGFKIRVLYLDKTISRATDIFSRLEADKCFKDMIQEIKKQRPTSNTERFVQIVRVWEYETGWIDIKKEFYLAD